jgi:PilZ domain-containing protein
MRHDRVETGYQPARMTQPRRSARIALDAEVMVRRPGKLNYRVKVFDVSPHGCRIEFVDRPKLDERAWIKFEGLEALEALVCWVDGFVAGVEFERPLHGAVFDLLVSRLH